MKKLDMNRIGDFKIQKYNSSNRTNSKSNGNSRLGGKAKQAYRSGTKSHTDDYVRNPGNYIPGFFALRSFRYQGRYASPNIAVIATIITRIRKP